MDFASIFAATTLLGVSVNMSPIHDFQYNYLDDNSVNQITSGSQFYMPLYPEVTIQGLTYMKSSGVFWQLITPYVSDKYYRGLNLFGTIFYDFAPTDRTTIRASVSFASMGAEVSSPCLDRINREFHCYYGTKSGHPYFTLPFSEVNSFLYRDERSLKVVELGLIWTMTF